MKEFAIAIIFFMTIVCIFVMVISIGIMDDTEREEENKYGKK